MTAKTAATFGAAFGGATGGVLAAGLAQYLSGDDHYLPLIAGALAGAAIAGFATFLVTGNSLDESERNRPENAPHSPPRL